MCYYSFKRYKEINVVVIFKNKKKDNNDMIANKPSMQQSSVKMDFILHVNSKTHKRTKIKHIRLTKA